MSSISMATAGLSAASAKKLRGQLTTLARDRVFPVAVETGLFAIFTVLIVMSTYILCQRGLRRSWPRLILLAATLAMYAISTLDWAIDVRLLSNDLHTLSLTGLPDAHSPFGFSSPPLVVLQGITSVVCIILGDAVVCWRVCAVWGSRLVVIAMGLFWVLGSIGVFTVWGVMFVGLNYRHVPAPVETLVKHYTVVNTLAFSWSAATNVWATAMVAYKAWLQRRELKRHLGSSGLTVHDILMLLVDFGVIYTVFMLLNVIVLIPSLNGGTFFSYVTMFMQQITGMYPTAIIALVALQKSHLDHQFTFPPSMHSRTADIETLPFTVKAGHSKDTHFGSTTARTFDSPTSTRYELESVGIAAPIVALQTVPTGGVSVSEPMWEMQTGPGAEKDGGSPVTLEVWKASGWPGEAVCESEWGFQQVSGLSASGFAV